MKIFTPPQTNLQASNVILGLMRISEMDDEEIRTLVGTARDAGINFFDHADVYGGAHGCEKRFGDAVTFTSAERESVIIQSKVGIREGFFDFSKEHILRTVDESLAALNTDYMDILLLHRPDTLVEPAEVAANMAGLDQSIDRDNGILEYSRLNDITLQAWSPFQKGFFDGVFIGDRENHGPLNDALDEIAAAHGVTPTGIAVAWITRHPANMQVVLGTTKPARVVESAAGSDIPLSREEWYRLFTTAGHILP
jgi:predicted oxidoreductase